MKEKIVNNKNIILIILSIVLVVIGSTYAWFTWRSTDNTNLELTIGDIAEVVYTDGNDIVASNIGPVLDINDGEATTFSFKKRTDDSLKTYIYITPTALPEELKEESFKIALLKSENGSSYSKMYETSFSDKTLNTEFLLMEDISSWDITYYKVVIYIDGKMENTNNMMGKNFQATIRVDADLISTPNEPALVDGMIPVVYDETNSTWVTALKRETVTYKLGDVNGDELVNSTDITLTMRRVSGTMELTFAQKTAADVDGDGVITENDYTLVMNATRGNITTFPAGGILEQKTYSGYNIDANQEWYDYNEKKWANAVMVNSDTRDTYMKSEVNTPVLESDVLAYYVWIPRYKYKLFNVEATSMSPIEINVKFENGIPTKSNGSTNGEWLTHPAFTFGEDELTGIWVGKFETTGTATVPTIKPNLGTLVNQDYSPQFTTSQKFGTTTYLTSAGITEVDAHMMKNIEWGSVAYLKQSKYGLGLTDIGLNSYYNTSSSPYFKTGCGPQSAGSTSSGTVCNAYNTELGQTASTTGNIYGVYDMSGGAGDNIMGVMKDSAGTGLTYSNSGFTASTLPYGSKYVDQYTYGTSNSNQTAYNRRILGDATGETRDWYSDVGNFVYSTSSWFYRSGGAYSSSSAGVFCFGNWDGSGDNYSTFRSVIVSQ